MTVTYLHAPAVIKSFDSDKYSMWRDQPNTEISFPFFRIKAKFLIQ